MTRFIFAFGLILGLILIALQADCTWCNFNTCWRSGPRCGLGCVCIIHQDEWVGECVAIQGLER